MESGRIQSALFSSPADFTMETYLLEDQAQFLEFFKRPVEGLWVLKNTSGESDRGLRLIADEAKFRDLLIVKLRGNKLSQKVTRLQEVAAQAEQ